MTYQIKEGRLSRLSARLNLMVVLVLSLAVSNAAMAFLVLHFSAHQKREVVPFGLNSGYVISDSSVDEHYLTMMSENFIYSRLNVTPQNVTHNHGMLLGFIDSSIYPSFKKQLLQEEELIKSKKISSHVDIIDVQSDSQHLVTLVKGQLKRYVGFRALKEEEKTWRIQYRYQASKLSIASFAEEKGEAHA